MWHGILQTQIAADAAAGQGQGAANAAAATAAAPAVEEPEAGGGYGAEAEQQMQVVAASLPAVAAAADGEEPASPSRRARGGGPRAPPIRFSGNHIVKPLRLRHQDTDQQRIRKRVWSHTYEQHK